MAEIVINDEGPRILIEVKGKSLMDRWHLLDSAARGLQDALSEELDTDALTGQDQKDAITFIEEIDDLVERIGNIGDWYENLKGEEFLSSPKQS